MLLCGVPGDGCFPIGFRIGLLLLGIALGCAGAYLIMPALRKQIGDAR